MTARAVLGLVGTIVVIGFVGVAERGHAKVRIASGDDAFDKKALREGPDPAQAWLALAAEPRTAALDELTAMNAVGFGHERSFAQPPMRRPAQPAMYPPAPGPYPPQT